VTLVSDGVKNVMEAVLAGAGGGAAGRLVLRRSAGGSTLLSGWRECRYIPDLWCSVSRQHDIKWSHSSADYVLV